MGDSKKNKQNESFLNFLANDIFLIANQRDDFFHEGISYIL